MVIAYLDQVRAAAMMERGEDPQPVLQDGFAMLSAALAVQPNDFGRGGDARPFVEKALAHLERAHAIDKKAPAVNESLASAKKLMAQLDQKPH